MGSEVFVKSFVNLGSIKQVINLEMMGRFSTKSTKPFVTEGINSSGLIKKLNTNLRRINPAADKVFFERDNYPLEDNFIRSDNYSFAIKGVPANTIMATHDTDKFYHSPSDDWRTLDFEAMTRAVKAIAMACTPLVQGSNQN